MKFLLDVCVSSRSLEGLLVRLGHDVVSSFSIDPRATDERLMAIAYTDDRILVTEDKDFGRLAFLLDLPHGPIVRFRGLSVAEQATALEEFLQWHGDKLAEEVVITLSRGRIRIHARES